MFTLYVLVVISFIVAAGFLGAFLWSVKHNQFEDGYTPSVRILFDDELTENENNDKSNQN